MLKGRLGLESARIPHADRHGLMYIEHGNLYVENGVLTFLSAGAGGLDSGIYQIPFQTISILLLAPGCTISHDALRLLARHGTGLIVVGSGGVRFYASMPAGPDWSELARRQTTLWADPDRRMEVVRRMYTLRLGDPHPGHSLETLRGIEGMHMKEIYRRLAKRYGIAWQGRRYDRTNPAKDDLINTAINHASTAVRAAARVAVAATGTVPQLGFIHEASGEAFGLDIADLFRVPITLPVAFEAARTFSRGGRDDIERLTRRLAGERLRSAHVIPEMIDRIKEVLNVDDRGRDA